MTYHRVCNRSSSTSATCGARIADTFGAPEFTTVFSVFFVFFIVFCAVLCRSLFVSLSSFAWLLYCLSLSDLWPQITHLVSSNLSYRLILARRGRWCRWKWLAMGSICSSLQLYWLGTQTTGRCRKKWGLLNPLWRRTLEVVWLIV